MDTDLRAHTHAYTRAYTAAHTRVYTCAHTYLYTYKHAKTKACTHTDTENKTHLPFIGVITHTHTPGTKIVEEQSTNGHPGTNANLGVLLTTGKRGQRQTLRGYKGCMLGHFTFRTTSIPSPTDTSTGCYKQNALPTRMTEITRER